MANVENLDILSLEGKGVKSNALLALCIKNAAH
jgi:hypothetical protein